MYKITFAYDHPDAFRDYPNAFEALRAYGVEWERYEGQPMANQVVFFGCSNVPNDMPEWITVREYTGYDVLKDRGFIED